MLSLVPTELLQQIIESTVPCYYHCLTYTDRQKTLCTLSLVSRRFRQIAQLLLRRVVYLPRIQYNGGTAKRILRTASLQGWDQDVRYVHMYDEKGTERRAITVDAVVSAFPRLAELAISQGVGLMKQSDLMALSRLPGTLQDLFFRSELMSCQNRASNSSYGGLQSLHHTTTSSTGSHITCIQLRRT